MVSIIKEHTTGTPVDFSPTAVFPELLGIRLDASSELSENVAVRLESFSGNDRNRILFHIGASLR